MSFAIVYGNKPERMPWRVVAADGTLLAGSPTQEAAQQTASQMRGPVLVVTRGDGLKLEASPMAQAACSDRSSQASALQPEPPSGTV